MNREKVFLLKTVEGKYFTTDYVTEDDFDYMFGEFEYARHFNTEEKALEIAEKIIKNYKVSLYLEKLDFLY